MAFGTPERNVDEDDDLGEERPDRTLSEDEMQEAAKRRLEEIHEYLRGRYSRREIVARSETRSGTQLDWVAIESQTREGKIAEPPEEDRPIAARGDEQRQEPLTFELMVEGSELGPPGTVPAVRRDIAAIRATGTLQDWLSKDGVKRMVAPDDHPDEIVFPEEATTHKYAFSRQAVTCYGTEGNINAWDPFVEWSNEFSLGQLSLSRGTGNDRQTLEVGHQEYRDLYGDWVPHLFVFYTTNNYTESGDNKGGYNQDVDGWVQYSQTIYPEAKSTPLSVFGGAQYIMPLKVQLWQGNWWVRVNGIWIGYYPASLYDAAGLRSEAGGVAWYGEVVDAGSHAGTTRTDMGNGHWPYEGWQHCAYMNNLAIQSSTGGGMSRYDPGTIWESHPNCYGIEGHFDNWGSWGPYFWWGGSGKNSACP